MGNNRRAQTAKIEIRVLPEAVALLKSQAQREGVSYTALVRRRLFGDALAAAMPAAPPPPPQHAAQLRRLLGHTGKLRSNVEQLAGHGIGPEFVVARMRADIAAVRAVLVAALVSSPTLDLDHVDALVEGLAELSGRVNQTAKTANEGGRGLDLRSLQLDLGEFRAMLDQVLHL